MGVYGVEGPSMETASLHVDDKGLWGLCKQAKSTLWVGSSLAVEGPLRAVGVGGVTRFGREP